MELWKQFPRLMKFYHWKVNLLFSQRAIIYNYFRKGGFMRHIIFREKRIGILFLSFILVLGSLFSQTNVQVKKYAVVIKDANIRSMPSVQGEIIYLARAGEKLEVLDDLGTWLKVKIPSVGTGFVWSKLVRIEVEKVLKPVAPPPKPTTPPGPKPNLKPSPQPQTARFGLSFNFNYALVSPDDFNATVVYFNGLTSEFQDIMIGAGYSASIDHPLEKLTHMLGGAVEGKFFINPNIALGLGFSYVSGSKTSSTILTKDSTEAFTSTSTLKASIFAPYFGVSFLVPSQMLSLEFFAHAGYFMGNFSQTYTGEFMSAYSFDFGDMEKSTLGFMGGVRLNINLQSNMGIFLMGKYTMVKFKDIPGKLILTSGGSTNSYTGAVYYYESHIISNWYPMLWVYDTLPSPHPSWMRNPRKAEFDFSGLYLGAGFFFRF